MLIFNNIKLIMNLNHNFFLEGNSSSDAESVIKSSCDKELAELARAQKSIPQVSKSRRSSKGKDVLFYFQSVIFKDN